MIKTLIHSNHNKAFIFILTVIYLRDSAASSQSIISDLLLNRLRVALRVLLNPKKGEKKETPSKCLKKKGKKVKNSNITDKYISDTVIFNRHYHSTC